MRAEQTDVPWRNLQTGSRRFTKTHGNWRVWCCPLFQSIWWVFLEGGFSSSHPAWACRGLAIARANCIKEKVTKPLNKIYFVLVEYLTIFCKRTLTAFLPCLFAHTCISSQSSQPRSFLTCPPEDLGCFVTGCALPPSCCKVWQKWAAVCDMNENSWKLWAFPTDF